MYFIAIILFAPVKIGSLTARDGFRNAIELMQQSARAVNSYLPGSSAFCDWPQLDRKIEAFRLFQFADKELRTEKEAVPLEESIRRAYENEAFRAIWILEGVGHALGSAASASARGLLHAESIPARAGIPLHAGMGTAFGEMLMAGLGSNPTAKELATVAGRFVDACEANCRPGWQDAAIEPLGLVVRCLYPGLLPQVGLAMEAIRPALRPLFWHGAGRSLYFVPSNFLPVPGAFERMVRNAGLEALRMDDTRNVLAGLVWAVTLVNLPEPATLKALLPIYERLQLRDEFVNGVLSAILAWRHMAPEDKLLLPRYTEPSQAIDHWENWVRHPVAYALHSIFPGLERRNNIPAFYTWRSSEELVALST